MNIHFRKYNRFISRIFINLWNIREYAHHFIALKVPLYRRRLMRRGFMRLQGRDPVHWWFRRYTGFQNDEGNVRLRRVWHGEASQLTEHAFWVISWQPHCSSPFNLSIAWNAPPPVLLCSKSTQGITPALGSLLCLERKVAWNCLIISNQSTHDLLVMIDSKNIYGCQEIRCLMMRAS